MIGFGRFLAWTYLLCSVIVALVVITNYGPPKEIGIGIGFGLFIQGGTIFCLLMLVAQIAENTQIKQDIGGQSLQRSRVTENIETPVNNVFSDEILHNAVWDGDYALARELILKGIDVNVARYDGKTPLALANERKDDLIIKLLVNYGAKA